VQYKEEKNNIKVVKESKEIRNRVWEDK